MVMPPIGICAIATRNAPSAAHRPQPERPLVQREVSQVASVSTIPTRATSRLPNSTNAWNPCSGYGLEPQLGQFSQPRPEPVRRTNAPDVITTKSTRHDARAIRRNVRAEIDRARATATATS